LITLDPNPFYKKAIHRLNCISKLLPRKDLQLIMGKLEWVLEWDLIKQKLKCLKCSLILDPVNFGSLLMFAQPPDVWPILDIPPVILLNPMKDLVFRSNIWVEEWLETWNTIQSFSKTWSSLDRSSELPKKSTFPFLTKSFGTEFWDLPMPIKTLKIKEFKLCSIILSTKTFWLTKENWINLPIIWALMSEPSLLEELTWNIKEIMMMNSNGLLWLNRITGPLILPMLENHIPLTKPPKTVQISLILKEFVPMGVRLSWIQEPIWFTDLKMPWMIFWVIWTWTVVIRKKISLISLLNSLILELMEKRNMSKSPWLLKIMFYTLKLMVKMIVLLELFLIMLILDILLDKFSLRLFTQFLIEITIE